MISIGVDLMSPKLANETISQETGAGTNGISGHPQEGPHRVHVAEKLTEYYVVEFPGFIKNAAVALSMLGGMQMLYEAFTSDDPPSVSLSYRRGDPFARSIRGTVDRRQNLIMKFIKTNRDEHRVEIVGIVRRILRFRGLSDIQILPELDQPLVKLRFELESLKFQVENPPECLKVEPPDFSPEPTMRVPPLPMYLRSTFAYWYNYEQNPTLVKVMTEDDSGERKLSYQLRKNESSTSTIFINFSTHVVPGDPRPEMVARATATKSREDLLQRAKAFLLEKRPIVTMRGLRHALGETCHRLKTILPAAGYRFRDGPYRFCWVRFGYDPRKDPESRFYQTFEPKRGKPFFGQPAKRHLRPGEPKQPRPAPGKPTRIVCDSCPSGADNAIAWSMSKQGSAEPKWYGLHSPTITYQLADVEEKTMKEVIYNPKYVTGSCSVICGWFTWGMFGLLRRIVLAMEAAEEEGLQEFERPPTPDSEDEDLKRYVYRAPLFTGSDEARVTRVDEMLVDMYERGEALGAGDSNQMQVDHARGLAEQETLDDVELFGEDARAEEDGNSVDGDEEEDQDGASDLEDQRKARTNVNEARADRGKGHYEPEPGQSSGSVSEEPE